MFAAEPVKQGQRVWTLNLEIDRVISPEALGQSTPLFQKFVERYAYFDVGLGGYLLDGDHSRFLNHSEMPAIDFRSDGDGYAARSIAEGEELTCNYNDFMPALVILPSRGQPVGASRF